MCVAELLELRMHRARPRSTAGVWRDDDDGCGVERHLSRRVCDASAVHDHALLHDVCHRRHADATAYGDHQVRPQRHYTHPFNGPPFGTTRVSPGSPEWHQLGHMQVCTLLLTDNHASTLPLCFLQADALPAAKPTVQSTEGKALQRHY